MSAPVNNWSAANQNYLAAALNLTRLALERYAARGAESPPTDAHETEAQLALDEAAAACPAPAALQTLCQALRLSSFEREVLLLCAGVELEAEFAALCAAAQGDAARAFPTWSLALAAFDEEHWSAITPAAPLRYWRLIETGQGSTLTQSPLRIDERVLHYLAGVSYMDERLSGLIEPLCETGEIIPSHREQVERLAAAWSQASAGRVALPIVQLCGDEAAGKRALAASACAALNLNLSVLPADALPINSAEMDAFLRLWEREAALSASALLIDCEQAETIEAARSVSLTRFLERCNSPLIISSRERRRLMRRASLTLEIQRPSTDDQRALWQEALGAAARGLNGHVESLVSQFNLSAATIYAASNEVLVGDHSNDAGTMLWNICRAQARPRLDALAQRLEPLVVWDDLVLPEEQRQTLREIAAHVRQRITVYETWGFAAKSARGLGISALFAGASGTGKTLAAEVLARELRLDLYRIDLSSVVSKYIGETEKNLRRVFDAAEEGGVILLFDEADALFGKRSEVKDSHDRYANIEVSYLLQRIEAYRGLAILTTNMKSAVDTAFLRRMRFIVQFPFPNAAERAQIWQRIFPTSTPTESLDVNKLASLNVTGGNIHNIALSAAFLAADSHQPVRMSHILRAARGEYVKLERSLTEAEIRGWE